MQRTFTEEIRHQLQNGSMLNRLIIVNSFVFLVMVILSIALHLNGYPRPFAMASLLEWFAPSGDLMHNLTHPWSMVLYMFLHINVFHFLMQMVFLYFAGNIFVQHLDEKKFLNTYLFGGLSGLIVYIVSLNVFPVFDGLQGSPLHGASAATLALIVAVSFHLPQLEVMLFGTLKIRLLYIALILIAVDLIAIPGDNRGARMAHLGGALYGVMAAGFFRKSTFILNRIDLTDIFQPERWFKRKPKMKVQYSKRPISDEVYNQNRAERQKRVDQLLDKINKSGYDSLTKEEKDFLFKASNNG